MSPEGRDRALRSGLKQEHYDAVDAYLAKPPSSTGTPIDELADWLRGWAATEAERGNGLNQRRFLEAATELSSTVAPEDYKQKYLLLSAQHVREVEQQEKRIEELEGAHADALSQREGVVVPSAPDPKHPERNWTEDFSHENGNYYCRCYECGCVFLGHKRRGVCKVCSAAPTAPPASGVSEEAVKMAQDAVDYYAGYNLGHMQQIEIDYVSLAREILRLAGEKP